MPTDPDRKTWVLKNWMSTSWSGIVPKGTWTIVKTKDVVQKEL